MKFIIKYDGTEALAAFKKYNHTKSANNIHFILMDNYMKEMDGVETTHLVIL